MDKFTWAEDLYRPKELGDWTVVGLFRHNNEDRDMYVVRHNPSGVVMIVYSNWDEFAKRVEEEKI